MRSLIIKILATALALYFTGYFVAGFQIDPSWQAYFMAAVVYLVFSAVVGPVIKLLLLPINLLTLGLLRWLTGVLLLYLFDLLYPGLTISAYSFSGYSSSLLALPSHDISFFWTLVLSSLVLSLTYSIVSTIFHNE